MSELIELMQSTKKQNNNSARRFHFSLFITDLRMIRKNLTIHKTVTK
jgi:hypothetical protein